MNRILTLALWSGILLTAAAEAQVPKNMLRTGDPRLAVPAIFAKAVRAMDRLRFAGTRTVVLRRGADRVSHVEYILHSGLNSRVWFPVDSPFKGQVIVETAKAREHYYPNRKLIEVLPPKRDDALTRLKQWSLTPKGSIQLTSFPGGRVAGRPTQLGVISDGRGNVRQRLWIDSQTGMILKREIIDNVGDLAAYFEFTSIDYRPVVMPEDFTIRVQGARVVTLTDKVKALAGLLHVPNVLLPASTGFELEGASRVRVDGMDVLHQTYQGKRGPLSLFEVQGNVNLGGLRPENRRGTELYGWQMSGHSLALVGSYPLQELKELAQILGAR